MNTLLTTCLTIFSIIWASPTDVNPIVNGSLSYSVNGTTVTPTRTQTILMSEEDGQTLIINANTQRGNDMTTLGISIKEAFAGAGSYTIGTSSCGSQGQAMMNEIEDGYNHIYQSLHCDGVLEISDYDKANNTISGSFSMTLTHSDDGTEVTITDGNFSLLPIMIID